MSDESKPEGKEYRMLPGTGAHQLNDGRIVVSGPAGCIIKSTEDLSRFENKFVEVNPDNVELETLVDGAPADLNDVTDQFNVEGLANVKVVKSGKKFKISNGGTLSAEMTKGAVASTLDDMRSAE